MNNHDWENLQFLLNASPETLEDWFSKTQEDDHEYAAELMAAYDEELKIKNILFKDDILDVSTAKKLLKRHML